MKLNTFLLILAMLTLSSSIQTSSSYLPYGFTYLSDVDPTIIQSVRYAQPINFVGQIIDGYRASKIIMTRLAATSVANVQSQLKKYNYSLVVYDAYRPQKAVNHFMRFIQQPESYKMRSLFNPFLPKQQFVPGGYVATKSGHTRGSTIDLTIIQRNKQIHPIQIVESVLNNNQSIVYLNDGSEYMCSHFDFMGESSHHDTNLVSQECLDRRNLLRKVMEKHGFKALKEEWWHYTLIAQPFPDTYFDFDIV